MKHQTETEKETTMTTMTERRCVLCGTPTVYTSEVCRWCQAEDAVFRVICRKHEINAPVLGLHMAAEFHAECAHEGYYRFTLRQAPGCYCSTLPGDSYCDECRKLAEG